MKHLIYYILLIFILIFNSCSGKQKPLKDQNLSVTVIGTGDDIAAFENINWIDDAYFFGSNHKFITKRVINDSLFIKLDSIKMSGIMSVILFHKSKRYRQRLFITPGDTIILELKNKNLHITGNNPSHYNFFKKIKTLNLESLHFEGDMEKYKKKCVKKLTEKNDFLDGYIKKNKNVSSDFIKKVKEDFKFNYLKDLMLVNYKNQYKIITNVIKDSFVKEQNIKYDLRNYFDNISLKEFDKPYLLNNHFFKTSLIYYIHYYFIDMSIKNFSKEKFKEEKKLILNNFTGELRDYAIARLIYDYGTFSKIENAQNLKTLIEEYSHNIKNSTYVENIEKIENQIKLIGESLNKISLNSNLIDLKGDTLTIKKVLERSNKIKVIDFWASWCSPCIKEFVKSDTIRNKTTEKDIVWIYFSIDKDKEKWLKKSKELSKYGLTRNQYLILNYDKSGLKRFLNLENIPRYIVLDRKNLIKDANAPRPSNIIYFHKIIDNINQNQKFIQ